MTGAGYPADEKERLQSLKEYGILDSLPEKEYDDITYLASEICQTPMSLVSLVDQDRQWFKSRKGVEATETPRNVAFCAHAILRPQEVFIVPDAHADELFKDNPLVTGQPHITFYAGVPLVNSRGHALGTLCVMDEIPHSISDKQVKALRILADQVVNLMELRKRNLQLVESSRELKRINQELNAYAHVVAHDIRTPLGNIISVTDLLEDDYAGKFDETGLRLIHYLREAALNLTNMVNGILEYSKNTSIASEKYERIDLNEVIREILDNELVPDSFSIGLNLQVDELFMPRIPLKQILTNLIGNAIKYNDKSEGRLTIEVTEARKHYRFNIADNGPGIAPEFHDTIFKMLRTLGIPDRYKQKGTGIGLATVKRLVEKLGGEIRVVSDIGKGARFEFTLRKVA